MSDREDRARQILTSGIPYPLVHESVAVRAMLAFADAERERSANTAYAQVILSAQKPRRTRTLGLRREAYSSEIAREVHAAVIGEGQA